MPNLTWQHPMMTNGAPQKRYRGANIRFFFAYNENEEKSLREGRPIFDEIPSISIQYPGGDETVRRIEPQDMQEYPDEYARFKAGGEPVVNGMPLSEWPLMTGSAMRELQYLGFRTVEQLAETNDEIKRKLGPLSKFIKLAQDWLAAAKSDQNEVTKLRQLLEKSEARQAALEEKLELMMQRVEANEGTDLRGLRRSAVEVDEFDDSSEDVTDEPRRRGRPRKV
jgi:hypothetical protein